MKEVLAYPNSNLAYPHYSLSSDFSFESLTASDILSSVEEDTIVYLRWYGKKVGYINCYFDDIKVEKALAFFNEEIWKLPSKTEGGIGTISYSEEIKNDKTILATKSMDYYCIGYEWDGWYLDKECTKEVKLPYKISTYGDINFYSKKSDPNSYQLNIKYTYNRNVIENVNKTVKYNTDLSTLLSELPSSLSGYEIISNSYSSSPILINGEEIQKNNNGWVKAADLDIEVKIVPIKAGYINCYFEGVNVGKTLVFLNNDILKLPSETEEVIETISYPTNIKNVETTFSKQPMNFYCIGYEWDGWYLDENCTQKVELPYKISTYGDINLYSKKSEAYSYQLNIEYRYGKFVIINVNKIVEYNTDLSELLSELPNSLFEYEINSDLSAPIMVNGKEIQQENNGWTKAGDLDIKVKIVPKYDGYFEVRSSTNSSIDGKLLSNSVLSIYKGQYFDGGPSYDTVFTTKPYGLSTSVAYKLSDIEEIKFKNGSSLPSPNDVFDGSHTYYSLLPNLKKIDLSEMVYIESIPSGFFYGSQNIEEVYAPNLPNLKTIGGGFLCYNNIKKFVFDFSNVTQIGYGFLDCAFSETAENITIDLSNLSKISSSTYSNCGFLVVDVPIYVSLKIGDYTSLYSYSFKSHSDAQCHYFINEIKSVCVANLTIYSHDAVVLSVQLEDLTNIKVLQY